MSIFHTPTFFLLTFFKTALCLFSLADRSLIAAANIAVVRGTNRARAANCSRRTR